jgi:hypothetical protein|tara:strand:- start:18057 stop:18182 length:126 start_codon:yes stop_codon:yes gene_type:complete
MSQESKIPGGNPEAASKSRKLEAVNFREEAMDGKLKKPING